MILKNIEIRGLYGAMNLRLNFNSDVTMLVGINGCGKTSVLNVIDWLLKPNFKQLYVTEFKKLMLKFAYNGRTYAITATKTEEKISIAITGAPERLSPITISIAAPSWLDQQERERLFDNASLALEKKEVPLWNLLQSFPKPIVITLDRTITAEADNYLYQEPAPSSKLKKSRPQSPINHVQEVTSARYSDFRRQSIANDNALKAGLMMSALRTPEQKPIGRSPRPMTASEIFKLKNKITKYLSGSFDQDAVTQQVNSFFDALNQIENNYTERSNARTLARTFKQFQYTQIENLAHAFNVFETKNSAAFEELKVYLSSINEFFKDSNKTLIFDDVTGQLVFTMGATEGERKQKRSINHLASGERQILILFTFLAFIATSGTVFIVDEPEISLHPKWQSEFMRAFLKLCPKNTQLLLATHSPEIVGNHKDKCATPTLF